jgi:ATP-dependent DNA helicase RecG
VIEIGSSERVQTANVISDHRLEGSISAQIQSARRNLRRWLPEVIRLDADGRFGTSTLIPEFVWLEAIVNAVTHRSYSIGRLPGLVRLENIRSRLARTRGSRAR